MEIDPNAEGQGGIGGMLGGLGGGNTNAMEGMTEEMAEQSKGFM